jgi:hypothetical protein
MEYDTNKIIKSTKNRSHKKENYKAAASICCEFGLRLAATETVEEQFCIADAISEKYFNRNISEKNSISKTRKTITGLMPMAYRWIRVGVDVGLLRQLPSSNAGLVLNWQTDPGPPIIRMVFSSNWPRKLYG